MKILFLSFYFSPDLSAGSFRSGSLVDALLFGWSDTVEIEVITTLPNRYASFREEAPEFEKLPNLTIHRIKTPRHNSGMLDQSKAFVAYAKGVEKIIADHNYDLVYATSSRLMTAILGARIARKLKAPLYLDIRDIFVDTIGDVLPHKVGRVVAPFFSMLERYAVSSAGKVNLVSAGFLPYFQKRYPQLEFEVFTNGIDAQFLEAKPKQCLENKNGELTVVYAGNIGEGQGLHSIVPELAIRFSGKLFFKVVGDGGRAQELLSALKFSGCKNVALLQPVKRDELIAIYQSADVLFLHLNDFDAFKKVLPSKVFEYAATGKPIWAGVAGYAAAFITSKIQNSAVFPPCDIGAAVSSFDELEIVTRHRAGFINEFSRNKIMQKMARTLIHFGQKK
ncbi:glycosyltransferase family 4 protein [Alphaproteobacteria bacterium]|nr:glycosyltransferase family 4 protein [Alphaproteobacteria bacterium]